MKHIVFMDTEASGLPEYGGEIIEIALLKVKRPDFIIVREFHTRIKPSIPMRTEVIDVTGINNEDLVQAPSFNEVFEQITSILNTSKIITKLVKFESEIIKNSFESIGLEYEVDPSQFVEMMDIEQKLGLTAHNDEFVVKELGLSLGEGC